VSQLYVRLRLRPTTATRLPREPDLHHTTPWGAFYRLPSAIQYAEPRQSLEKSWGNLVRKGLHVPTCKCTVVMMQRGGHGRSSCCLILGRAWGWCWRVGRPWPSFVAYDKSDKGSGDAYWKCNENGEAHEKGIVR